MKSGSTGNAASKGEEDAPDGRSGKPPHWRRRKHAGTTAVYVVHPTEFRTVVQQLTGAELSPPLLVSSHQHVGSSGNGGASTSTRTNAVAPHVQHQHGGGEQSGGSRGRTLGQMHQDLLAWANADDDS